VASLKFQYIILLTLFSLAALLVHVLRYDSHQPNHQDAKATQSIPLNFVQWQGRDLPLDELVYEILETRAIIHREYASGGGEKVFLSIVHYGDTKVDFHAPEACLGGLGLQTIKSEKKINWHDSGIQIKLDVAEMITERPNGQLLTYYFYMTENFFGANYIKMRLNIAKNKITRNKTSGSLVRISTTLEENNREESEILLLNFLRDIFPLLKQSL